MMRSRSRIFQPTFANLPFVRFYASRQQLSTQLPLPLIQRIQTIYLTLAALASGAVYFTPITDQIVHDPVMWITILYYLTLVGASCIPLAAVFLFGNRRLQATVARTGIFFAIVLLGIAAGTVLSMGGFGRFLADELLSSALPVVSLLLQVLALRAIHRDEELVRSIDRIR